MDLQPIKIIKQDERGIILDCGKSLYLARKQGTTSADHVHPDYEIFYLVSGEAEITVETEVETVKAPVWLKIEPNQYHKIVALTDIELIHYRETA